MRRLALDSPGARGRVPAACRRSRACCLALGGLVGRVDRLQDGLAEPTRLSWIHWISRRRVRWWVERKIHPTRHPCVKALGHNPSRRRFRTWNCPGAGA